MKTDWLPKQTCIYPDNKMIKKGLIKVSLLFPGGEDVFFDEEYYVKTHLSEVTRLLGGSVKGMALEKGISGGAPGSVPPYIASGSLYFETLGAFEESFVPHAREILADIPNFTNSKPVIQISEVVL